MKRLSFLFGVYLGMLAGHFVPMVLLRGLAWCGLILGILGFLAGFLFWLGLAVAAARADAQRRDAEIE